MKWNEDVKYFNQAKSCKINSLYVVKSLRNGKGTVDKNKISVVCVRTKEKNTKEMCLKCAWDASIAGEKDLDPVNWYE